MGDRFYSSRGFEEDPEILRFLRASWDWEVNDHDGRGEAVRRLYDEIRSESTRKFEQWVRDGGFQIEPLGRDSARRRFVANRRQHPPEFYRSTRGNQDEREVQAQLRGACECDALHGYEQAREDLRCQIGYYSSSDRYSPDRCTDSAQPVQHPDVPDRFRTRIDSSPLPECLPYPGKELLQFVPPHRNAVSD